LLLFGREAILLFIFGSLNHLVSMCRLLLLLFALHCFSSLSAQGIYTIGYASYGGVNNLDVSPVSVGSYFKSDVNLFALSAAQDMKDGQYRSLLASRKGLDDIAKILDENEHATGIISFDERVDIAGPSFLISPGKIGRAKRTFGLVSGMHSWMQVRNFNSDVFQWNNIDLAAQDSFQSQVNMSDVAIRRVLWGEYGINYSEVVWNRKAHEIAVGGTIKLFQGLNAFVASFDYATASLNNPPRSDSAFFQLTAANGSVFHSSGEQLSQVYQKQILTSSNGYSYGGDVGFTYSFKPRYKKYIYEMDDTVFTDQTKPNYLFRLGASVKNLGSLSFKNAPLAGGQLPGAFRDLNYAYSDSARYFDDSRLTTWDSLLRSDQWLGDNSKATTEGSNVFRVGLPTALNLFADVQIAKGLSVCAQASLAMGDKNDRHALRLPNVYQLVPKFETAKRGIYIPVTYNEWSQLSIGAALRMGSFNIAVSNLSILNTSAPYSNAQVSMGLRVLVPHKRHADDDNDKISNPLDDCPTQPGPKSAKGCPDADFDSIRDDQDKCKDEAGLPEMSGCPDLDRDGITDKEDGCPSHFGPERGTPKKGCPDADADGFVENDVDDKCPGLSGHVNGCPDSDGDGVMDNEDKCPSKGGKPELMGKDLVNGCPDTDGDGIYDFEDDCEEEFGSAINSGCPLYDYDGDQVYDFRDRCITIPGVKENDGCPADEVIPIYITESVVYFAEGAELTPEAIAELRNIAADLTYELQEDPRIIIELIGHCGLTENVEDKMAVSLSRAEAVKGFLMKEAGIADHSLRVSGKGDREEVSVKTYPVGPYPDRLVEIVLGIPEDE